MPGFGKLRYCDGLWYLIPEDNVNEFDSTLECQGKTIDYGEYWEYGRQLADRFDQFIIEKESLNELRIPMEKTNESSD